MSLPIFKDATVNFSQMQTVWAATLNPVLANPATNSSILKNVALASGTNNINHLLGRKLQGWRLVRQRSAASVYDNQDNNQTPTLTLILVSSAVVNCDIEVF